MDTTWKCRGTGAGNWSDPRNWTNGVPGPGDTAIFDDTSQQDSVVDSGFQGMIANLEIKAAYCGTITLDRDLTITETATLDSGRLAGSGNLIAPAGATFRWSSR